MLVLSRKPDETIVIGGDIRLRVLGINGNNVRLGIDAPIEVAIRRGELLTGPLPSAPMKKMRRDVKRSA